jgi:hypothetical protein
LEIGVTVTVILVARRSHCSANPYNDNSACLSYNPSIHGAFALIVLGAALFAAAALAATDLVQRRTGDPEGNGNDDHPSDSDSRRRVGNTKPADRAIRRNATSVHSRTSAMARRGTTKDRRKIGKNLFPVHR